LDVKVYGDQGKRLYIQLGVQHSPELFLEVELRLWWQFFSEDMESSPRGGSRSSNQPSGARSRSSQTALPEPLLDVPAGRPPEAPRGLGKISTEFDLEDRRPLSR